MPAGANWTLRYPSTVDGRIQARGEAGLLRRDEFVREVRLNITRTSVVMSVQFSDDREGPYDPNLTITGDRLDLLPDPILGSRRIPLSRDEVIAEYLNTCRPRDEIARAAFAPRMADPIRRNIDYSSIGRRTLLVDLPEGPLPSFTYVNTEPEFVGRLPTRTDLEVRDPNLEALLELEKSFGTNTKAPCWLAPDIWVTDGTDYAVVEKIQKRDPESRTLVHLKIWRKNQAYHIRLHTFLEVWKKCEEPEEPQPRHLRGWVI